MKADDVLKALLAPTLDKCLSNQLTEVNLSSFSRIPAQRIARTACTHIAVIESVSGSSFREHYQELYESSFHGGERERSDLIVTRLEDELKAARKDLAPYHVIGLRDDRGVAIGAAQFSVLFLPRSKGLRSMAVPYMQYIYIRTSHRRQDLSEVLHTLTLAVALADARKHWNDTTEVIVPYTLCETEPPNHGSNADAQAKSKERAGIHSKSGSVALMLRDPSNIEKLVSAHVQPGLEPGEPPLTLIWILRSNPALARIVMEDQQIWTALIEAYYKCLRDEGFPEENIRVAEGMVQARRSQECQEFCLLEIKDVKKEMYVHLDPDDIACLSS